MISSGIQAIPGCKTCTRQSWKQRGNAINQNKTRHCGSVITVGFYSDVVQSIDRFTLNKTNFAAQEHRSFGLFSPSLFDVCPIFRVLVWP